MNEPLLLTEQVNERIMSKINIKVDYTDNFVAYPANEDIACVVTAKTFKELQAEMMTSLREHIDWMKEDGDPIPAEFEGNDWEYDWDMSVRAILHHTEKLIPKSALANVTGINQQQLTHYASGYRVARPAMKAKILKGIQEIANTLSAIS